MTLRTKFVIFAFFIHSLLAVMAYFLLQENKFLFIGMEIVILISVVVTVQLYRAFFRPLLIIRAGIESIKDKDFSTKFMPVGQEEMDQLVGVYNTMIEKLRQERVAQAEKHHLLEKLTHASPAGIMLLGFDNYIESINPAASRFIQLPATSLLGKHIQELPAIWAKELAALEDGKSVTFRINGIHTYRCHRAHFIDRGFQHYFIILEELTEAIIKNERQAYEKVIRMMSHEVNNSAGAVNSILGSLQYYTNQLEEEHKNDYERALEVAIDRNTNLSKFMANFADVVRLPLPKKAPVDLVNILNGLERLLQPEMERRNIRYTSCSVKEQLVLPLDQQQIEQAILNILKNAMESIGQDGEIKVSITDMPMQLTITDNGPGIPEHVRPQLFTPFFSTKETGQGIGLTMIREILLNHDFQFDLKSDQEKGETSFVIQF